MKTVYRYALEPGENEIEMVSGAEVLSVAFSSKGVLVFALVEDANIAMETRRFVVAGNGEELPEEVSPLGYRGTAKVPGGPTAHVFEVVSVGEPAA